MAVTHLAEYLEASASRWPDRTAVVDPGGWSLTYGELNRQADALAGFLATRGIEHGDRVGVVLPKSVAAVVAFFGIMKAGGAYVPVDYTAPAERGRRILTDCQVRAVVVRRSVPRRRAGIGRCQPCCGWGLTHASPDAPWPGGPRPRKPRAAWTTSPTSSTPPARPGCPKA